MMAGKHTTDPGASTGELSFEAVYSRLEEAVQRLEDGGLSLDQSIELFEQGMRLAKQCRELLDGAELRITTLSEEFRASGIGSPERAEP
jgi:exodeoxyribonuclease VII small subunit